MLLNYHETLSAIEKFMIESGIRAFCTDICKGQCCNGCHDKSCITTGEYRLACSFYLCTTTGPFSRIYALIFIVSKTLHVCGVADIFFSPIPQEVKQKFKIDKKITSALFSKKYLQSVKQIVDTIIEANTLLPEKLKNKRKRLYDFYDFFTVKDRISSKELSIAYASRAQKLFSDL